MKGSFDNWEELDRVEKLVIAFNLSSKGKRMAILDEIWERISEFIRFFPRLAFRSGDEDRDSDFYLYVMERRETLLEKFDPELGSFRSYLSIRLRSHYLNFFKRERRIGEKNRVIYSDKEEMFTDGGESRGGDFPDVGIAENEIGKSGEPRSEKGDKRLDKTNTLFPDYEKSPLNYLVLKLHYWDFFTEEDFIRVREYTGRNYGELLEDIEQLRSEVAKKKNRRIRMDEKLNNLYIQILHNQEMLNGGRQEDNSDKIIDREKRLNHSRRLLLEVYRRANEFGSLKCISKVLAVDEIKVANIIGYQRKILEKKIYGNQMEA